MRVFAFAQVEFVEQILGQMPTTAFGKNGLLADKLHTAHVIVGWFAIFANAHITRGNAAHRAIIIIEDFGGRKPRINFDTKRFGLFAKPATEIAKRDDIIAMIVHAWWGGHAE